MSFRRGLAVRAAAGGGIGRAAPGRRAGSPPTLAQVTSSLAAISALLDSGTVRAVVSDLDGVLRVFDPRIWDELDARLGIPPGTAFGAILGSPVLHEVVRGRATHAQWRERARDDLRAAGAEPGAAAAAVARWADDPAAVDPSVRRLLLGARSAGATVMVLTNGTDRVREEVGALGLADVVSEDGRHLLSSHETGHAKPEPEAYAAAHRRLEELAGRRLAPAEVAFLDDSPRNVAAAERFGWRAFHHRS